jgi:lysyl-tRNA synthetase class II
MLTILSFIWQTNSKCNFDLKFCNTNNFTLPIVDRKLITKFRIFSLPFAWHNLGDVKFQANKRYSDYLWNITSSKNWQINFAKLV